MESLPVSAEHTHVVCRGLYGNTGARQVVDRGMWEGLSANAAGESHARTCGRLRKDDLILGTSGAFTGDSALGVGGICTGQRGARATPGECPSQGTCAVLLHASKRTAQHSTEALWWIV